METTMPGDDDPAHVLKRPRRWPAFLAGLLLGGGIAIGVMLALWNQPGWWNDLAGHRHDSFEEVPHKPTEDEIVDYLDGKTFSLPVKDINEKPKTITVKKDNLSDLKWSHGSRIGGDQEPWTHTYSCLYSDESGAYILDLRIPVRVVGSRRVFLPFESGKVTPVEMIVTPKKK
jgi:hypothetical protein